jgi:hypothetical protein
MLLHYCSCILAPAHTAVCLPLRGVRLLNVDSFIEARMRNAEGTHRASTVVNYCQYYYHLLYSLFEAVVYSTCNTATISSNVLTSYTAQASSYSSALSTGMSAR